jgi:hypothetical protein
VMAKLAQLPPKHPLGDGLVLAEMARNLIGHSPDFHPTPQPSPWRGGESCRDRASVPNPQFG